MTGRNAERGSVAVEVAVIAPAFVVLMLLVVLAGRVSATSGAIDRAAREAARAASIRQHPTDATRDAEQVAATNLRSAGVACTDLDVAVDARRFRPGGDVEVTVRCTVPLDDLALLGVPGSRTFTATSVEVIDRYRSGP